MPALLSSRPNATSSADGILASPKEHPVYYMPRGNVVIRVQTTLFKLDLSVLHTKSPVLRIIMPPVYAGKTRLHGFNHDQPFALHEVSEVDFVRLLWVLYPSELQSCQPITVDDWVSILKLSTRYQIEDIRNLAVARLHALPVDPVRKIVIWEDYCLDPTLLVSSYVALCQRVEPLTLPMTMALGLKTFTKLAAARDLFTTELGSGVVNDSTTRKSRKSQKRWLELCFLGPR